MKYPFLVVFLCALNALGADIDTMGGTLLHQVDPTLQGNGVIVGQPEADDGATGQFEVNPSFVNQPTNFFTWISSVGTSTSFTNLVGIESGHADGVAKNFYGNSTGVAQQVAHVYNYDADYFFNNVVAAGASIPARVVNQSFVFSTNGEQTIDADYDDAAVQYGVLFVSGAGNGGNVFPAATCYNGIGVGVYPGSSSFGPTYDGRCKPDIVSPGSGVTSFSTPFVSGSAAVLIQAAARGDGGANTSAANDNRTIKALLLNGAIKPAGWTNGVTSPLDARYGAGVLNVFNSWSQLKGGKHAFIESTSVASGSPHPPGANSSNESSLTGWDLNSIAPPNSLDDEINHYYFNVTGSNSCTLTATLVWLRPHSSLLNPTQGINNLNLFLYNTANNNLVLSSTSPVDNVEHLFLPTLPPGRYDLQVEMNGAGEVSPSETYALAFDFFNTALAISETNNSVVISWPLAPAGFQLQSTPSLTSPVAWSTVANHVTVDTNSSRNIVSIPSGSGNQFFRVQQP